jgi:hypothetical protein
MTHAALASLLGPEFDDFLYASIDEPQNGKLLSVLSALTRLDIDPWREAAKLARLPKDAAIQRMAALIATLPDEPSAHRSAGAIAARLIALLPCKTGPTMTSGQALLPDIGSMTNPRAVGFAIFLSLMLLAFCNLLSSRSPTPVENPHPPLIGASEASPPTARP